MKPILRTGMRILLLGATGTIGRATLRALVARGHDVVCLVRPGSGDDLPTGAIPRHGQATDPASLLRDGIRGERFDALVSCLASRTGVPRDAWAVDHRATVAASELAQAAGATRIVLLSAICVQLPLLEFQKAKLAAEAAVKGSGLAYSIVRPTAFFKSLSGQIDRLRAGRPYLLFGDGTLTACKPISDADLGAFIADCLTEADRADRILPIGGPGPAVTPRDQGHLLFDLLQKPPRFRSLPPGLLARIAKTLGMLGPVSPALRRKAELARIGHYYATQSMLVLDPKTGLYDAASTPEFGDETLADHYARVISSGARVDRGDHAVF